MSQQTQELVQVTGHTARCSCGWEGNWAPLLADAQAQADEHDLEHVAEEKEAEEEVIAGV